MKSINEYFSYLFTLERTGMKYDLINISKILNSLGNPHNRFQSIHIAGTNGKGAAASFISSILMEHGIKTGLFTSPHILRFNERIRINGRCITDNYIEKFLNRNIKLIKRIKPSFFEVTTAMAFEFFARHKIDTAVVECGLGGRLDSTNVLHPALSVITQIGMDHMQYLGNTLQKIAKEKIGIVKPGVNVIVNDNNLELKKLFREKIHKSNLYYLDDNVKILKGSGNNSYIFSGNSLPEFNYTIPLSGKFQSRNAAAAIIASVQYLKNNSIKPSIKKIKCGLKNVITNTGYRARLESVRVNDSEYIFDVSHNPGGLTETFKTLKNNPPDIVIFGIMEDKDIKSALIEIMKISGNIIFTKANYKRASEPEQLYKAACKISKSKHTLHITNNINEALNLLKSGKIKGKRILLTGSFFVVSDAINELKLRKLFI